MSDECIKDLNKTLERYEKQINEIIRIRGFIFEDEVINLIYEETARRQHVEHLLHKEEK